MIVPYQVARIPATNSETGFRVEIHSEPLPNGNGITVRVELVELFVASAVLLRLVCQ